jgi:coenzyme F420-reducing hydrogenase beta subunit
MNWEKPKSYAVKNKNEAVINCSRSGGFFSAISDKTLSEGGVVYGCVLTSNFLAKHIRADNVENRNRMRGSKYIQSSLGETFKNVKMDLANGKQVLFSGTSCQVAGLKKFIGKEYNNLLCIDIVCHGVPSKKIWKAYLKWQEAKNFSKVVNVDFRNKKDFGWNDHVETIFFQNGKSVSSRIFRNLFYGHNILRPSCYECPYKSLIHPGDITIADYWGIEKAAPEFNDNKGVSLVLVNSDTGKIAFELVKNKLIWKHTKLEDSLQPPLLAPFPRPDNREQFWMDFNSRHFEYIAKKYGNYGFKNDLRSFLGRMKRKIKKAMERDK